MKLLTGLYKNAQHLGVVDGDRARLPALDPKWRGPADMLALIDAFADGGADTLAELRAFAETCPDVPLAELRLMSPIPRPRQNVICLGWNYLDHVSESASASKAEIKETKRPDAVIVFTKAAACVCGPYDDIPSDPEISKRLDWEVELGVVIGRAGHKIAPENALEHVFGYTVVNDISARELQRLHKQFYLGKSVPKSCPVGPFIVTADEIPDPQALRITSRVNGEVKQDASTADQIFDIRHAIATISKSPAVEPGDIIATGTPAGVGFARTPPEYLQVGDLVECEIERVGVLRNRIVAA